MRKILVIGLILVLILSVSAIWGSNWLEDKIESEIESIPFLSYDSLDISVFSRSLKVFNLKGKKDKYTGEIDLLKIKGLEIIPLISDKKFIVDKILIEGMSLDYHIMKVEKQDSSSNEQTMPSDVPEFLIESIEVKDGFFSLLDNKDSLIFSTKLFATLADLNNSDIQRPSTIPGKLVFFEADSARFFTKNGLYEIDMQRLQYEHSFLHIDSVKLSSRVDKLLIGSKVGHEIDWYNASIDSIAIDIADAKSFLKKPKVSKMTLYQPVLNVFRDKRLPFPEDNDPPLIREILSDEKLSFSFDTIQIENGNVTYEEFVKEEKGPGEVSFNDLNATISNLTSYSFGKNISPRLTASCQLYDVAPLYVDVSFPESSSSTTTIVKGKLLPVDLTLFNRMIKYVSVVEVESGRSRMLEFDFTHTDTQATGEMKFAYADLSVAFLEKQETEPGGVLNAVKGFFVNTFVVDSNNNFESDKFRIGKIDFVRIEKKSMFNFWWGSVLTGFKSSTGVDTSGEKIDVN